MIKVLIVEDSLVSQELLIHLLTSDPEFRVAGVARDGQEAVEAVNLLKPDIITMDIHMPKMNGFDATRRIMETRPTPIVVVSGSLVTKEVATVFRAIEAGALAVVHRPPGIGHPEHEKAARELLQTVKLMSEIKVVRRYPPGPRKPGFATFSVAPLAKPASGIRVVAVGASTGGPLTLKKLLSGLPKDFPLPILVVQHIAPGFVAGFVEWLSGMSPLPLRIAVAGQALEPGQVYIAPDSLHLGIDRGLRIALSDSAPENGVRPSVSHLFRSVAEACRGEAVGILLTGMGRDGAQELKVLKELGALTIAQDEESSVVFGMPGEAVRLGAALHVLPPEEIAALLARLKNGGN